MTNNFPIKWAFFGTDEFAVDVLSELKRQNTLPSLIVSTPDKPKGRKLILTPSPVKQWALAEGITVITPTTLKEPLEFEQDTWDLFLVASYGKIIPARLLTLPQRGVLNIHPSLLPKHRGPSPLETTILEGDPETGVTLMLIDEQVDHGPIIEQQKISLTGEETYSILREQLATLGAKMFVSILANWLSGKIEAKEQDHSQATHTKKFTKEDGLINLSTDPELNHRKIRAFSEWPGAYFFITSANQIRIKIIKAHLENSQLVLDRVIPEGKQEMNWADYKRSLGL